MCPSAFVYNAIKAIQILIMCFFKYKFISTEENEASFSVANLLKNFDLLVFFGLKVL